MNRSLTQRERIWNLNGIEECERLHGIHQLLVLNNMCPEEFYTIWSRREDAAWGYNWGWLVGFKEIIKAQLTDIPVRDLLTDIELRKQYPEAACANPGRTGFTEYNELNSGVVEIADDGQSCRAAYLCHGIVSVQLESWAAFTLERYGADFIYDEKDGHWKYLHEQVAMDSDGTVSYDDGNIAMEMYRRCCEQVPPPGNPGWDAVPLSSVRHNPGDPPGDDEPLENFELMPPVRSGRNFTHYEYTSIQPVQRSCCPPEPYATLTPENTYPGPFIKKQEELFFIGEKGIWSYDPLNRYTDEFQAAYKQRHKTEKGVPD